MKFSVIIPVYNKANTIAESIYSVLSQTEKDYELIIVNDGSSDNLNDVLKNFVGIRIINQENGGVSRARNAGINAAQGDYICFLDADDLWFPNHLEELSTLIRKYPNAGMFSTSHTETTSDGKLSHSSSHLVDFQNHFLCENLFELLNKHSYNLIHTNCVCVNKSLIHTKKIYFEPGEKIGEDTDMWYRVALNCSVALSKKETTMYRRENSTATKHGHGSFTWIFARRWETIKNGDYNVGRKNECEKLIERYKLSCSRNYMLLKDRKNAKKLLNEVRHHNRRYYLTLFIVCLPYSWSKKLITRK